MDEKLKKEREELQNALQSVKIGNSEAALSVLKNQKDADQMKKEKSVKRKHALEQAMKDEEDARLAEVEGLVDLLQKEPGPFRSPPLSPQDGRAVRQ